MVFRVVALAAAAAAQLVAMLAATESSPAAAAVVTPQPTQPAMVPNCTAFYLVKPGDTCNSVAAAHHISVAQFRTWNGANGPDCVTLLAEHYACVAVSAVPTTTSAPVATPTPYQPGMIAGCRCFYHVRQGNKCVDLLPRYNVSLADLVHWNPDIRPDCSSMWTDTYLCVGVAP